jgi:tetratricopeptide (TPR) repeat protein
MEQQSEHSGKPPKLNLLDKAEEFRSKACYGEAAALYRKALRDYGRKKDASEEMLRAHLGLGDTLRMTGDFTGAADHYLKASGLAAELKRESEAADAKTGLSLSYRAQGQMV